MDPEEARVDPDHRARGNIVSTMASFILATLSILCIFCNCTVLLYYTNYVLANIVIYLCASCACFNDLK